MSRTEAIENRAALFRKLLDALGQRRLKVLEIAKVLKYTPSGARAVIKRMKEAGLVQREDMPNGSAGLVAVYELSGSAAEVDQFIAAVEQAYVDGCANRDRNLALAMEKIERRKGGNGRLVHTMGDQYCGAKAADGIPAMDPVMAALFGRAAA